MTCFSDFSRWAALGSLALLIGCGDSHETMAVKSQKAFEEAQRKGIPIAKGGHGGHTNAAGGEEMGGMPGMAATSSSAGDMKGMNMPGMKPGDMKGMDMSGMKHGDMKGMDMSGMKHGDMKGMDMSGMKHGDMKGLDMSGMKHGDMKGMDMSGRKPDDMKGMDMSGMKPDDMKGMDMSGMKHGDMKGMDMSGRKPDDMKGMDMSGMKHGDMKGMDMSGMAMSPVVPQPKALQAQPGETAATLQSDSLDSPAASSVSAAQQSAAMNQEMVSGGGMTMSMGSYVQRDVGRPSGPEPMKGMAPGMPGMKHESTPQPHGATASPPKAVTRVMYVCAAHPEIMRDQPGKCPVDGTPLVKKEMP